MIDNVEEILNSMVGDMKKYKKEYDEASIKVNNIIKDYSTKIDELQKQRLALQDEGNKKIDELNAYMGQLSGKYSSLYEQYRKITSKEPNLSEDDVVNSEVKVTTKKVSAKKSNAKKVDLCKKSKADDISSDAKSADVLSEDEIAKINEITKTTKSLEDIKPNVDNNGNEIPEYLKDSYVK